MLLIFLTYNSTLFTRFFYLENAFFIWYNTLASQSFLFGNFAEYNDVTKQIRITIMP